MNKIIKIEPAPKYYSITWMLGSFCNYDCSYCPSEWHDTTSRPHDLDTMKTVWRNIYEKTQHLGLKYKISFTGGEVTANKNFLPLLEWMRAEYSNIAMIVLTTNGSASANYYTKLANVVESISFEICSPQTILDFGAPNFFNNSILYLLMLKSCGGHCSHP